MIEPDPENPSYIFVITDDEQVYKLEDIGETKANIVDNKNMVPHDLEV